MLEMLPPAPLMISLSLAHAPETRAPSYSLFGNGVYRELEEPWLPTALDVDVDAPRHDLALDIGNADAARPDGDQDLGDVDVLRDDHDSDQNLDPLIRLKIRIGCSPW